MQEKEGEMANEQIVSWIRENQSSGYDIPTLRGKLLGSGYSQKDVDDAIKSLGKSPASRFTSLASAFGDRNNVKQDRNTNKKKINRKVLWGAVTAVILFWALLAWLFWPRQFLV